MAQTADHEIHSTQNNRHWVLIPSALVFLGVVVTWGVLSLASHFHSSGIVVLGIVLIGMPALVLGIAALSHAASNAINFLSSSLKWWHVVWMLTFVSAFVFRNRRAADIASEPLDAWAIYRVVIDVVVAFVLLGRLALRRTHWVGSMLQGVIGMLTVFGLVSLASTVWSVYPTWTLYKSWEYLLDIAVLAAILATIDSVDEYRSLFNWTWALYGVLLLSVWKDALLWPHEALYSDTVQSGALLGIRLDGIMPAVSANDVGTFAAILGLLSLARLFPASQLQFHRPWYTLLLLGSLVTMVIAQTRTAIAGFLFGGLIILLFSQRAKLGAFLTFVLAPLVALCTMGGLIWSFLERGQTQEQMSSLSSRANWWAFAWQIYLERPLTGFGAYAAGRFAVMANLGQGLTSTMHSDYLETIVGSSIWGLIPFVVALLGTWWLLFRYIHDTSAEPQQRQLTFEALAILALLTFRSVFMTMLTWHPPLHFLSILGFAEFVRRRRRAGIAMWPSHLSAPPFESEDSTSELVHEGGPTTPSLSI